MTRRVMLFIIMLALTAASAMAQRVSIEANNEPAASVFRRLMTQTDKNFVYSADILDGLRLTVKAKNQPLGKVLDKLFANTDIEYKIKGNNVVLKRSVKVAKRRHKDVAPKQYAYVAPIDTAIQSTMLNEVVVVSRLEAPMVETAELGTKKLTAAEVRNTPTLFGESDVIKALQMQPGIAEASEGMAGMNVHGGGADENLYMLDNVPLYQVNHFGGLFSAFNTDIIRYIDFFKSSMPAKYDGRLSSFMDVRTQNGNTERLHGSARLGLTSGALNLNGPIGSKTRYLFGLRRSWYDVLTIPALAIINSQQEEDTRFHYYFTDLNAKIIHRFSPRATGVASVYFGDDLLKTGGKDDGFDGEFLGSVEEYNYDFHWGNLVAQAGLNYRFAESLSAEFTAAYSCYFAKMKRQGTYKSCDGENVYVTQDMMKTKNNINDWIFRGDFDWQPAEHSRIRFGANYIRHSFLPARTTRVSVVEGAKTESQDSTWAYHANEVNAYIEDDWRISRHWRANAGLHASLFNIDSKTHYGVSPRLSVSYRPQDNLAIKGAYSRTTQYVHQLSQTYLSLPTDQWIPITGKFKPQTADKVAIGAYWQSARNVYAVSVEGYYKWMHNLIDYCDEYYLKPPMEFWDVRLTTGSGTAKGIDFKVEKLYGKLTGHIAYSLAWADRTFEEKNGGKTYPARFDHRHTIKISVNWEVSHRVQLNAAWTGHSGNRFTLQPQMWETPAFGGAEYNMSDNAPLRTNLNNYQLPFYHRLDLSCTVKNSRGYWSFGLYNAYNHMNTIAVRRSERDTFVNTPEGSTVVSKPVFQKVKLLPIIPSISYTWQF